MAADAQVPARPAPSRRGSGGGARLRLRLRRLGRGATPFLLLAPAAAFGYVVPCLVALASVALLAQPGLRRWIEHGSDRPVAWPVAVFVVSIYGGYFGAEPA